MYHIICASGDIYHLLFCLDGVNLGVIIGIPMAVVVLVFLILITTATVVMEACCCLSDSKKSSISPGQHLRVIYVPHTKLKSV